MPIDLIAVVLFLIVAPALVLWILREALRAQK